MSLVSRGGELIISGPDWVWAVLVVLFILGMVSMLPRIRGRF